MSKAAVCFQKERKTPLASAKLTKMAIANPGTIQLRQQWQQLSAHTRWQNRIFGAEEMKRRRQIITTSSFSHIKAATSVDVSVLRVFVCLCECLWSENTCTTSTVHNFAESGKLKVICTPQLSSLSFFHFYRQWYNLCVRLLPIWAWGENETTTGRDCSARGHCQHDCHTHTHRKRRWEKREKGK